MKHIRILILATMVIAALFMAGIPALATSDFDPYPNWSFEYDGDSDGVPNWWHMRGDTVYVCGHPSGWLADDCFVGFLASDQRAVIYQRFTQTQFNLEEAKGQCLMQTWVAAKNLNEGRVYGGHLYQWDGLGRLLVYEPIPGGTYADGVTLFSHIGSEGTPFIGAGAPDVVWWGFVALPGEGQFAIDRLQNYCA